MGVGGIAAATRRGRIPLRACVASLRRSPHIARRCRRVYVADLHTRRHSQRDARSRPAVWTTSFPARLHTYRDLSGRGVSGVPAIDYSTRFDDRVYGRPYLLDENLWAEAPGGSSLRARAFDHCGLCLGGVDD